nr:transposase [Caldicellulosiruptor acetigenus]
MEVLEEEFEDAIAVLELLEPYRRRLRTTNMLEQLNGEIRRRKGVIKYFINRESCIRLISALLMKQDDRCLSTRK